MVGRENFLKGTSQYLTYMNQRQFTFGLGEFFLLGEEFYFFPIATDLVAFLIQDTMRYLVRLYKKESQVREYVIDVGTPTSNLDIHLFIIDTIAISTTLGRDNRVKMRLTIPLIRNHIDKSALFYTDR